jgi:hypothetical protein
LWTLANILSAGPQHPHGQGPSPVFPSPAPACEGQIVIILTVSVHMLCSFGDASIGSVVSGFLSLLRTSLQWARTPPPPIPGTSCPPLMPHASYALSAPSPQGHSPFFAAGPTAIIYTAWLSECTACARARSPSPSPHTPFFIPVRRQAPPVPPASLFFVSVALCPDTRHYSCGFRPPNVFGCAHPRYLLSASPPPVCLSLDRFV